VDSPVVRQRPLVHRTTRISTMVDMMHSHGAHPEEGPTTKGDEYQCTSDDLLNTFLKTKKHKLKK
jgi:hypothetical protein